MLGLIQFTHTQAGLSRVHAQASDQIGMPQRLRQIETEPNLSQRLHMLAQHNMRCSQIHPLIQRRHAVTLFLPKANCLVAVLDRLLRLAHLPSQCSQAPIHPDVQLTWGLRRAFGHRQGLFQLHASLLIIARLHLDVAAKILRSDLCVQRSLACLLHLTLAKMAIANRHIDTSGLGLHLRIQHPQPCPERLQGQADLPLHLVKDPAQAMSITSSGMFLRPRRAIQHLQTRLCFAG